MNMLSMGYAMEKKKHFHIHMAGLPAPRLRDSGDQTITANEEACRPAIFRAQVEPFSLHGLLEYPSLTLWLRLT